VVVIWVLRVRALVSFWGELAAHRLGTGLSLAGLGDLSFGVGELQQCP